MTIWVCSREKAVELAGNARSRTAVISITSKEEKNVFFPDTVSVLHLKFNDLTEEYDEEGIPYGRPLPEQKDFEGLKEFVRGLECECLIVHCHEGRSRSAAVAKAVCEFRGRKDELRFDSMPLPNPLVYALACRELGITFS